MARFYLPKWLCWTFSFKFYSTWDVWLWSFLAAFTTGDLLCKLGWRWRHTYEPFIQQIISCSPHSTTNSENTNSKFSIILQADTYLFCKLGQPIQLIHFLQNENELVRFFLQNQTRIKVLEQKFFLKWKHSWQNGTFLPLSLLFEIINTIFQNLNYLLRMYSF